MYYIQQKGCQRKEVIRFSLKIEGEDLLEQSKLLADVALVSHHHRDS